jgi:hypothetical protein
LPEDKAVFAPLFRHARIIIDACCLVNYELTGGRV